MHIPSRFVRAAVGVAGSCAVALAFAAPAGAANVALFALPSASSQPSQLINGPDGRLWFSEEGRHEVGRIDPVSGQFAPIGLPFIDESGSGTGTTLIVRAANGTVWAFDNDEQELYRITAGGSASNRGHFEPLAEPDQIVPAAGSGIWTLYAFHNPDLPGNDYNGASIIGDGGASTLITNQTYEDPHPGATDPADGSLWSVAYDYVTHIGLNGAIQRIPTGLDATYDVSSVAIGPDGTPWFTAYESGS